MNEIILFVLKSTVVTGILYIWYLFALKNKHLHNYNRFFLLFTLYASIQIPLLKFNWSPNYEKPAAVYHSAKMFLHTFNNSDKSLLPVQTENTNKFDWQIATIVLVGLVSLILLTAMVTRILWLVRKAKKYPKLVKDKTTILQTDLANAPFSFMNRIFWNESISMETENGKMILRHELAHIKQKHTYDKLANQLLTSIFWMNPFYWFIQKELAIVHEFIADEQAIIHHNEDVNETEYPEVLAKMLLHVHTQNNFLTLENHFFSSPIKRRLMMLQTKKPVKASLLRRAAVLPLIAGSILIFSFNPLPTSKLTELKAVRKIVLVVDAGHGGNDEGCRFGSLVEKDLNLKIAQRINDLASNYNIEVHLSRTNDVFLSQEARVSFSNKIHPDDFISLHIGDQIGKETGKGTFDIIINDKNAKAEESKQLAYAIYKSTARPDWDQKNTLTEKNPFVLRENSAAAVLIEIGDIKNKTQMQFFTDEAKLNELCARILTGVVEAHKK